MLTSIPEDGSVRNGKGNVPTSRRRPGLGPKSKSIVRRSLSLKKFSVQLSTEDYNQALTPQHYGPYGHLRKELDYTYHSYYRKERQWLQDSIIEDMLDNLDENSQELCFPAEPWLIFSVGPRGAGKRYTIDKLVNNGQLPLLGFVMVDPDEIRRRLPEFGTYSKLSVDELTRKESGYIAEILMLAALQAGKNVIVDGVMRDSEFHLKLIEKLRSQYSNLKVGVFNVTAPLELVIQRCQKKALETGRQISQEESKSEMEAIQHSIEAIKPVLDLFHEIRNGSGDLKLVGEDENENEDDEDDDWAIFFATFLQECAWRPGMSGKQKMTRAPSIRESIMASQNALKSAKDRKSRRKRFSVLVSSEENNAVDNKNFFGIYSHIRKTLDYTYHKNYTFERQKMQDAIISDMLDEAIILDTDGKVGTVPTQPWIVFTAGAMGAGKGYTVNVLVEKKRFPLRAFVIVDPDEIRRLLPEYHMYIEHNAELAGSLTRKEAGFIAEILTLAALQAGKNVMQDGSLRDHEWYKIYFARLKEDFPSVRQAIIHVTAPKEAVIQRAQERAITTGRIVPRDVLEAAIEQVPRSVNILGPLVDYYAEILNAQGAPDVVLTKPTGSTWDEFRSQWNQTVAYVPNRRKIMEKAKQVVAESEAGIVHKREIK